VQYMKKRIASRPLLSITAVLVAVLMLIPAFQTGFAQGITGSITGTVTDPTGSVVAGATVTVRQIDTNAVRTVISSDAGTYKVTQLQPGHYSVKVEKAGFKSYNRSGILLAIDQVALIDSQLEVGSQQESVEVTTTGPVIQTEDSSVGQVIDSQALQNTPLNGRLSVMGLIALAPGIQGVGAQDQLAVRGLTVAAGTGSRNSYGGLGNTLDGVNNQEVTLQRSEPEIPSIDALSQFKVLATGAPAEFNQPTQVIVVTSSGTNAYHGELLEYNRSKGTSAKSYFNGSVARPYYERNEYGGNFAGPITIPHVYNGKDRSFFFVAFEGFRLNQSSSLSSQQPTDLERQGVFTEFTAPIINPATGSAFANQTLTSMNSVSLKLMNLLYPKATTTGTGTNTYELVPYNSTATRFSLRLDHAINDKNQIRATFLRAFYGPNPDVASQGSGSSLSGGMSGDGEHNTNTILGWTHTFSPTLLLDTYASYFHLPIYRTPQNVGTNWESIIPGLSSQLIEGAPQITISNITNVTETGSKDLEQVIQANAALTKVYAKHTIKAGASYVFDNHWNESAVTPQRGSYTFNGQYSGNAFADFLLGLPQKTGQGTPGTWISRNISSQYGAYIQDDWKPMPKLTVNMGVRYDLQWFNPGPYAAASSLFVPSLGKVVIFDSSYPSSAISSYVTLLANNNLITLAPAAGLSTNPFGFLGRPNKNFAPRLGFAYQLLPNTVLRGAFGLYFNLLPASYVGNMFGTLPFEASESYTNSTTYASAFTMSAPFSATGAYSANPSVNAEHSLVTPYTEEYNLAIEHQFSKGLDVRVGYVGQHNIKQNNASGSGNTAPNINLADPIDITKTVQATNLIQPLSSISLNVDPIFHSMMNSLQVGVHKQYTQGLAFGAEYQWIRVLGTENIEDPSGKYPRDSYGPIAGMTPQVLQFNYSYLLPLGKGQWLFGNAGDTLNKFIRGWQISGATDIQTGQPFSVTYTATTTKAYPGLVSGRANRVSGVALYPAKKTRAQWFNPAAFTAPTDSNGIAGGAYGTSGYDMLRGPRFQNWDMSLQKNTKWLEHYNVQLRADAFNVFNHPNLAVPNAVQSNSNAGTITATSSTPSYEARTMEFAAKFTF